MWEMVQLLHTEVFVSIQIELHNFLMPVYTSVKFIFSFWGKNTDSN